MISKHLHSCKLSPRQLACSALVLVLACSSVSAQTVDSDVISGMTKRIDYLENMMKSASEAILPGLQQMVGQFTDPNNKTASALPPTGWVVKEALSEGFRGGSGSRFDISFLDSTQEVRSFTTLGQPTQYEHWSTLIDPSSEVAQIATNPRLGEIPIIGPIDLHFETGKENQVALMVPNTVHAGDFHSVHVAEGTAISVSGSTRISLQDPIDVDISLPYMGANIVHDMLSALQSRDEPLQLVMRDPQAVHSLGDERVKVANIGPGELKMNTRLPVAKGKAKKSNNNSLKSSKSVGLRSAGALAALALAPNSGILARNVNGVYNQIVMSTPKLQVSAKPATSKGKTSKGKSKSNGKGKKGKGEKGLGAGPNESASGLNLVTPAPLRIRKIISAALQPVTYMSFPIVLEHTLVGNESRTMFDVTVASEGPSQYHLVAAKPRMTEGTLVQAESVMTGNATWTPPDQFLNDIDNSIATSYE